MADILVKSTSSSCCYAVSSATTKRHVKVGGTLRNSRLHYLPLAQGCWEIWILAILFVVSSRNCDRHNDADIRSQRK